MNKWIMQHKKEWNEYQRRYYYTHRKPQRQKAEEQGLCVVCFKKKVTFFKTCEQCREKNRLLKKNQKI